MSTNNFADACTSYMTCGILFNTTDVNWAAVGAAVLLVARLAKDVPDAIHTLHKYYTKIRKKKKKVKRRVKSKR